MYTKPEIRTARAAEIVESLGPAVAFASGTGSEDTILRDLHGASGPGLGLHVED
jgi:hypothetical protein